MNSNFQTWFQSSWGKRLSKKRQAKLRLMVKAGDLANALLANCEAYDVVEAAAWHAWLAASEIRKTQKQRTFKRVTAVGIRLRTK